VFRDEGGTAAHDALILVADPDAGNRSFLDSVLQRAGFRVRFVPSGREALAAAKRERPRLALLEVQLGDISGYEVCRALKEDLGSAIQIIFLSADRNDPCDRIAGLLIGADDYLAKPVAGDELLARVRALARRADAHDDLTAPALRGELTKREFEVLRLLADGLDQSAIATQLVISHKTVGKHIEHILQKLPARSRAEAVAIAYRRGPHPPGRPARASA
jgi:DNA-binding NarL/FixJ family response regulator